jgi:hypothetical protein
MLEAIIFPFAGNNNRNLAYPQHTKLTCYLLGPLHAHSKLINVDFNVISTLRGKQTAYNGGSKCVAFVRSKTRLENGGRVYEGMMHIADWLPTLLGLVDRSGVTAASTLSVDEKALPALENLDGIDMWEAIVHGSESPREDVVLVMDEFTNVISYQRGGWKVMLGHFGDGMWSHEPESQFWVRNPTRTVDQLWDIANLAFENAMGRDICLFWIEILHVIFKGVDGKLQGKIDYAALDNLFSAGKVEESSDGKPPVPIQLFDISTDPFERENLALKKEHQVGSNVHRIHPLRLAVAFELLNFCPDTHTLLRHTWGPICLEMCAVDFISFWLHSAHIAYSYKYTHVTRITEHNLPFLGNFPHRLFAG